jgi:FlgD Ig-like domain
MKLHAPARFVIGTLTSIVFVSSASAQVAPGNMQSGCTAITAASGLLETSLYIVPSGYNFVLTDFSFSPSGYGVPPSPATWAVSMWIRNFSFNNDVRWVTGGLWDASGNHNWPVRMNWTTGIVFPANEQLRFGISGAPYPASTVCWSGYLVASTTSSVPPPADTPELAMRVAPNPARDQVQLSFELARSQPVVLSVFSVEGRRIRVLERGTLEAGRHQLTWDGLDDHGKRVANGMYFARLEATDGSRTTGIVRIQ